MGSSSAELKSFLLSICIDAPESATNSLSSGFFEEGARNDQTSEGEKNVALSLSLSLQTFFAESHASLRAHLSCCKVFFLCSFLDFLVHKDCALEVHTSE